MIRELDTVVLARDLVEHGLRSGDVGAVVHCHPGDGGYDVEFVAARGGTLAVLTLTGSDIRPIGRREILHVRALGAA